MVPVTIDGIVTLLLLVLPGLHYDLIRKQRQPDEGDSAFVEISRILIAGVFLSGITLSLLGLAHKIGPAQLVNYHMLLVDRVYIAQHLSLTATSITWFLVIALTLGSCVASLWPYEVSINSNNGSAWLIAFSDIPQQTARRQQMEVPDVFVQVKMKNGLRYKGLLQYYSKDAAIADRELVLKPPLTVYEGNNSGTSIKDWHRIILPASEIDELLVHYRSSTRESLPGAPTRQKLLAIVAVTSSKLYGNSDNSIWLASLLAIEICALLLYVYI